MNDTISAPQPGALSDSQRQFVLASRSPRRFLLMKNLGFQPDVVVSAIEEVRGAHESPGEYTRRLAAAKAQAVRAKLEGDAGRPAWILAADTIVILENVGEAPVVLEKPTSSADAARMLRELSGREHVVETSFCWLNRFSGQSGAGSVRARVEFRVLDEAMIARYVATGEPADKAGAYGIQDVGSALVRRVEGSYFAVVGLPVCEVVETLQALGGLDDFPFAVDSAVSQE